jgi:Zn-dependent metalloprotease
MNFDIQQKQVHYRDTRMKVQSCLLSAAILSALAVSAPASAARARDGSVARAHALLASRAVAKQTAQATADQFIAGPAMVDADGTEHVRFSRLYQGLPMIGGDLVLHSRNGQLAGVSQTLATSQRPGVVPALSNGRAIVAAGAEFGADFTEAPNARLVVYARGVQPVLAYEVVLSGMRADQTPREMHYFVDADSGAILGRWDGVQTAKPGRDGDGCADPVVATGTGHSLTEGTVALDTSRCGSSYQLKDLTRGGGSTTNMGLRQNGMGSIYVDADNTWGNGALNDSATVAADAHYGVSATWDYYLDLHGRHGIADDGVGAISRVHYGRNYANAFWSDACFCMTFGDGDNGVSINPLVALDIAGHEMSHGITSRSAGLIYDGESGGLNEATSDIFGTMVEYHVGNPNDPGDYMIGEKIYANNPGALALRYMFKPSLDGLSPDCYAPDLGDLDVHYSSGVANHFYYLLAEGAVVPDGFGVGTGFELTPGALVCNGNTAITGIGRDAASKIWYRALTVYMTSDTDYAGARAASLSAATDLYGAGSAQALAVAAAWSAVSVN